MSNKYSLTVAGKTATFIAKPDENFSDALARGAAKLGYRGGAFIQPNFDVNGQVTVMDKPVQGSNARQSYNGTCTAA